MDRKTAIFVNGGMGRSISSIPAIEKYVEENADKDPVSYTHLTLPTRCLV